MTQLTNEELALELDKKASYSSSMTADLLIDAAARLRSFDQAQNLELLNREEVLKTLKADNTNLRLDIRSWMKKVTDLQQSEADFANANRTLLQSISALKLASVDIKFKEAEGQPLHEKLTDQYPAEHPDQVIIMRLFDTIQMLVTSQQQGTTCP